MFGFVQPDISGLTQEDKDRYQFVYCGLCHSLGRYGITKRLALTYDMTFLALFLSSMYEPDETRTDKPCIIHPFTNKPYYSSKYIDYCADMTVALMYFKCLDDWKDDKNILSASYSFLLKDSYIQIKEKYPEQCSVIETELIEISNTEAENDNNPDRRANSFGRIMSSLFNIENDIFNNYINEMSFSLGRFIYFADAYVDYEKDIRKNSYNPLRFLDDEIRNSRELLEIILGCACDCFEQLPLEKDLYLMRNILYSGIWNMYNLKLGKEKSPNDS